MPLIKACLIRTLAIGCIVLTLIGTMTACFSGENQRAERPLIVTTIFPPYDFACNVAGEYADVELLVDVTDSHSYSPTAMDMVLIEESDIFIYTGGEGDLWAEDFLSTIDCTDKIVINMLDAAEILLETSDQTHHDHEHDHDHVHEHDSEEDIYDEHIWLSPINAISITSAVCDALCAVDPDHSIEYQNSSEHYISELNLLNDEFQALADHASRKTVLVADRFPFLYLCEQYGLDYYAALPGCSSASDLTALEYEALAKHLKEERLPVIFTAEYSDGTIAQTVKRESGCEDTEILTLHSCHTLTRGQIADGKSYLSLMRENLKVLTKALG